MDWLARLIDTRRRSPEADFIWQSRSQKIATERRTRFPSELVDVAAFATNFATRSGITLVAIAPGEFMFGGDDAYFATRVTISRPYFLGATEVTQAQWQSVMGNNPSIYKGETLPVEYESWEEAKAFCKKLTEQERMAGRLPVDWEITLPTDAQWEYADRAGTTANYLSEIEGTAWNRFNSSDRAHPVGLKKANAWGLYDMRGNLEEFCLDNYSSDPLFGKKNVTDPEGPEPGSGVVVRGGDYKSPFSFCCPDWRSSTSRNAHYGSKGFRVALCLIR